MATALLVMSTFNAAWAGEKLLVFGQSARPQPGVDKKTATGFAPNAGLNAAYTPAIYPNRSATPRPRPRTANPNSERARQMRIEREERANWAMVEPGELSRREEAARSGDSTSADPRLDPSSDANSRGGYVLYGVQNKMSAHRQIANQSRNSNASDSQSAQSGDADDSFSSNSRSRSEVGFNPFRAARTDGALPGPKVSSGFDVDRVLRPNSLGASANAEMSLSGPSDTEFSSRSFLRGLDQGNSSASMDSGAAIGGIRESGRTARGTMDPINRAPDATSQALNPTTSRAGRMSGEGLLNGTLQPATMFPPPNRSLLSPSSPSFPSAPGLSQPSFVAPGGLSSPSDSLLNGFQPRSRR